MSFYFVANYLGVTKFGSFSYAISLFAFFELVTQILNQDVFKKALVESDRKETVLFTVLAFQFSLCFLLFVSMQLALWAFDWLDGERKILLSILAFSLLFRFADILVCFFSAEMKNEFISKSEIGVVTLFNGSRIFLTYKGASVFWFAGAVILQRVLYLIFYAVYFIKNKSSLRPANFTIDLKILKSMITVSLPLFLSACSITIFSRIDQVMLGHFLSDDAVGIYSVVTKFFSPWSFVSVVVFQATYPILIQAQRNSLEDFNLKTIKTFSFLLYSGIAIIVGTVFFADEFVSLLFKDQYGEAAGLLKVHIFAVVFLSWLQMTNAYEVMKGLARYTLYKTFLASFVNMGLNYFLIEKYGIWGATYSTVLTFFCAGFLFNVIFKELRPLFYLQIRSVSLWKLKFM